MPSADGKIRGIKMTDFDYQAYVREQGLIWVEHLGYVSPQMHAEMMRDREQWKKDEREIRAALVADFRGSHA